LFDAASAPYLGRAARNTAPRQSIEMRIMTTRAADGERPGERFLSSPEVEKRYNKTRETLRRWTNDPRVNFPKPIKFGPSDRGPNSYALSELAAFDRDRAARSGK
jgi:predicted DNA-binding transcriptional regulator AlpA